MARRAKAATPNQNGDAGGDEAPKRGPGRPRKEQPSGEGYTIELYREFLDRIDDNTSDLNTVQADRRELLKAEHQRGLSSKADKFVRGLRAEIRNDKLTLRDAQSIIDSILVYWDWSGLPLDLAADQGRRQEELETEPAI